MKAKDFRDMTIDELNTKIKELSEELFNLRFRHAIGQLESPAQLKNIKKDIARAKTILIEKKQNA